MVTSGVSEVRVVTTKSFDYDKHKSFLLELYVQVSAVSNSDLSVCGELDPDCPHLSPSGHRDRERRLPLIQ